MFMVCCLCIMSSRAFFARGKRIFYGMQGDTWPSRRQSTLISRKFVWKKGSCDSCNNRPHTRHLQALDMNSRACGVSIETCMHIA